MNSRKFPIVLSVFVLLLTVPWLFSGSSTTQIFGFPTWAFYAIAMTTLYAILLFFLLGKYWDKMVGEEENQF